MSNDYPERRARPSRPEKNGSDSFGRCAPRPPRHLDRRARKLFIDLAEKLTQGGVLRTVDGSLLGEYCQAVSDVESLTEQIRSESLIVEGRRPGEKVKNPLLTVLREARTRMLETGDRLGMNPKSRTAIKFPAGEVGVDDDWQEGDSQMELLLRERDFVRGAPGSWNAPDAPSDIPGKGVA